ncbi:MAG: hypothetical protein LAT67_06575 [Balneolales bacterium]|nr:hypothetical protein [Balneolales bacterium]
MAQNSISNMSALGDSLWIGPFLQLNIGNSPDFIFPANADSIAAGRGRLFSISLAQDTVVAGLGFNDFIAGSSVQTGMGFHISTDGGVEWSFIPLPLDNEDETTIPYGGQQLTSVPVIVPQQSVPYNVTFSGDTIFYAGWASGIRRSTDFGQSWERLVLPPRDVSILDPSENYDFVFDPRLDDNFLGFSVMVDSDGFVWAGTAGGINISENALTADADQIRWQKSRASNSTGSMLGNWIIRIRENPADNGVWLTNWIAGSGEQQGLVVSYDKGLTFERHLSGQRIYDVNFSDGKIFAAGDNGVFISSDNGQSWNHIRQIRGLNSFIKENADYLSVATGNNRVWIGTTDGIAMTEDGGETWDLIRVNFPLSGGNQFADQTRDVRAYAYPNPFSRRVHDIIRIKFEAPASGNASIRLYDFGMNLVREIEPGFPVNSGQNYEAVWDGIDAAGRIVANGPIFYRISVGGSSIDGKILVLD